MELPRGGSPLQVEIVAKEPPGTAPNDIQTRLKLVILTTTCAVDRADITRTQNCWRGAYVSLKAVVFGLRFWRGTLAVLAHFTNQMRTLVAILTH